MIDNIGTFYIKFKRGTEDKLKSINPMLLKNELVIELPNDVEGKENELGREYLMQKFKCKIGDGIHKWNDLPYFPEKFPAFLCMNRNGWK